MFTYSLSAKTKPTIVVRSCFVIINLHNNINDVKKVTQYDLRSLGKATKMCQIECTLIQLRLVSTRYYLIRSQPTLPHSSNFPMLGQVWLGQKASSLPDRGLNQELGSFRATHSSTTTSSIKINTVILYIFKYYHECAVIKQVYLLKMG